jgi:hypothetical protein
MPVGYILAGAARVQRLPRRHAAWPRLSPNSQPMSGQAQVRYFSKAFLSFLKNNPKLHVFRVFEVFAEDIPN